MQNTSKTFRTAVVWRLLLVGIALQPGMLAAYGEDGSGSEAAMKCDIEARDEQGALRMRGVVHAEDTLQGVYEFDVRTVGGSGSSSIRQSGQFSVNAGRPEYLGQVQFGAADASYEAKLTLRFEEGELVCSKRIDGKRGG